MNTNQPAAAIPSKWALLSAFAAVYIIWGSTYLGIRIAVETIPPFIMLGTRFALAGTVMYGWLLWRGQARPSWNQWRTATLTGGLMLFVGTGSVAWSEQYIASGLAALLVTTVPLWMVLLDWLWKHGSRPKNIVFLGLLLGLIGIVLLVDPTTLLQGDSVNVPIALLVLVGALSWATGSIYGRTADLPANPFMTTAMQMLGGGALLTIASLFFGEWRHFDVALLSLRSFTAWTYLVIFGAFIAFSAYVWLLKHTTAARAATYAYVNPVVAVFLGWALADEPLNLRILVAVVLLVSAVILITRQRFRKVRQPARSQEAASIPALEAPPVLVEAER